VKVINKSTSFEILEKISVQTEDTKLKLRGTDLASTIDTILDANVIEHGASTIDAKTFMEILDKVKTEDVRIKFDIENEEIIIVSGSAKFKILNEIKSETFPDIDSVDKTFYFTIDREEFVKGVGYTLFSVSKDTENKQFLSGINLTVDDSNKVTFISTDSQRLSKYETMALDKVSATDRPFTYILPSNSAKIMQELAKVPGNPITIYWAGNIIMCEIDNSVYYSRLIEAKYPDISRVIPKDFNTEISIGKNNFLEILGRMNIASKDNGDRTIISCAENEIVFSAETKEHNILIEEQVNCVKTGANIEKMCIHVRHVMDALAVFDNTAQMAELKIVGAEKAFMIKMEGNEKFTHVLMPIRL
ncbi:MAG: DNA polymerase III subunit beta, partial [Armatimonadetes bacterium]|nr:DNA polymerase III subunit beta [Candidatus Hippobium faecium]